MLRTGRTRSGISLVAWAVASFALGCGERVARTAPDPGRVLRAADLEGFLTLRKGKYVVTHRPEHAEIARMVARDAEGLERRFKERAGRVRSLLEEVRSSFHRREEASAMLTESVQRSIAEIIATTVAGKSQNSELYDRFLSMTEKQCSDFARNLQQGGFSSAVFRTLEDFLVITPLIGHYRIVTRQDIEDGRIPALRWAGDSIVMDLFLQKAEKALPGIPELPHYVPVLPDDSKDSGYRIVTGELLSGLSIPDDTALDDISALEVVAHEATEIPLLGYLGWRGPFIRWLSDGIAQYTALKCIAELQGREAASKATGSDPVTRYGNVRDQVNLLAWAGASWEQAYSALMPREPRAHYAFATSEIQRLVSTYGDDALRSLVVKLGSAETKDQVTLRLAIFEVTGSHEYWRQLRSYSESAAQRIADELGEDFAGADADVWYRRTRERYEEEDIEGAWRSAEILAALEPAWIGTRVLRAVLVAEREGEEGRRSVRGELAIMRSQLRPGDKFHVPAASPAAMWIVLDQARWIDPQLPGRLLASLLDIPKRTEDVVARLKQTGLTEKKGAWFRIGRDLLEYDQYVAALRCLDEAVREEPGHAEAWRARGLASYHSGGRTRALECFEKAIELDGSDADAWFFKAATLNRLGRSEDGRSALRRAARLGSDDARELIRRLDQNGVHGGAK